MANKRGTRPPPEAATGLRAGPLVLRFALGYAAFGVLVYLVRAPITGIVGRAALDMLALADPVPRITALEWTTGFAVGLESPLIGSSLKTAKGLWPFALLFPLGVLVAAPGIEPIERLRRGILIAVGGLVVSAFILAGNSAHALGDALGAQGLVLYPAGRARAHFLITFWAWSLYAITYPLAASLYALAPALPALRAQFGLGPRGAPLRTSPPWRRAAPLVLVVLLAVAIDGIATRRVESGELDDLVSALEPINDDIGRYFVRAGQRELGRGNTNLARRYFTLALRYPEHATRARDGLRKVRTAADAARGDSRGP